MENSQEFLDDESSSLVPVFLLCCCCCRCIAEISTFLQYVNCHIIAAVCYLSKSHCKIMCVFSCRTNHELLKQKRYLLTEILKKCQITTYS